MSRQFLARRIGFILIAVSLTALMPAQGGTNDYTDGRWALANLTNVLQEANDITTSAYPNCDMATVEQRSVRVYRADGTGEAQDETYVKVLTEKGRRANRTVALSYMLPYATPEVPRLEIIKPGGETVPVDVAANSKDTIDDSQMAANIYDPNTRILQVNIPKLEIGDMVHSVTRMTTERAYIPGQFAEENVLEGDGLIRHLTYEVFAPADRPLQQVALRDEIPGTVTYSAQTNADGSVTHLWTAANVPRMFEEPAMPPYEMVLQRLYVSTLPDWQAVSKWYWDLSKPHLDATTPQMQEAVSNLIAGAQTDMDKIKAVFYHVSKNIRYMGLTPEKDRPGFEPHDVSLTFGKEYGVCRDKAALLVAMLREAGLPAYPVLISVGVKRDPDVPDPDFNHAIVGVELAKGNYLLMDPTDENTRDLLPSHDCNQSYLICRPEGEKLLISPVKPPEQNLMRVRTTGTLSAAGVLTAQSELSFTGVNDDAYRNAFVKMKPDDVRRFFERDLKVVLPGAKLQSLKVTPGNLLDMSTNLQVELEFSASGLTANGNGKAIVTLPWIGRAWAC
jgi:transglutaminase-like putative cysteine protease